MARDKWGSRLFLDDHPLWSAVLSATHLLTQNKGGRGLYTRLRHAGVDTDIDVADAEQPVGYQSLPPKDEQHVRLHQIRVPEGWLDRVAHIGYRDGRLEAGEFILDCTLAGSMADGTPIFEVDIVRQSRGYDVRVERIYVVRWASYDGEDEQQQRWHRMHAETRHASLKAAKRAKEPSRIAEMRARERVLHEVDMGVIRAMEFQD